jgi:hypothetical protein
MRATGRPRLVIVTVSPAAASATTADAFCFNARIPTLDMSYIVAPRRSDLTRRPVAEALLVLPTLGRDGLGG